MVVNCGIKKDPFLSDVFLTHYVLVEVLTHVICQIGHVK